MFRYFENWVDPFPDQEPTCPPGTLYHFCRYYSQGLLGQIFLVACLSALIAIVEMFLYGFIGQLVDWLEHRDPATIFSTEADTLILMLVLILFIKPLASCLQTVILHQSLFGNFPMRITWWAHRYLLSQSWGFYQNDFAGRLATKVLQTSTAVKEAILRLSDAFMYVIVYFFSMMVLVGRSDLRLVSLLVIWLFLYIALLRYFIPRLQDASQAQADARSLMTGRLVDSYTNARTVKLFSHSGAEAAYARQGMQEFLATVYPQMRLLSGLQFSIYLINSLLLAGVVFGSLLLWRSGTISSGAIAVTTALVLRLQGISQWIMWEVTRLFENIGKTKDGMSTLSKPVQVVDKPQARPLLVKNGEVEFSAISFNYGLSRPVFENLSLRVSSGERLGLVGRSGVGKSTLVNLLLRFYDVESGGIYIDGQNIAEVQQDSLRAAIGMVTQDTALLHRSIYDNLTYGMQHCSHEDVIAAARNAEAYDFIMELEDSRGRRGFDAHVGERGVRLSGGQRQRIAVARVLLKNAPLLILDEATSALDSEVEVAIQRSLIRAMHNKTVIAIAHRLSTIASMDRLIVLDNGGIIEEGTHSELVAAGGLYATLWEHQSGGFLGQ